MVETTSIVDARSHEYSAFDKEMKITIQKKKYFQVRRDYFEILKSESTIRIQQENVKISKEQLNRAERYFKAGMKTNVDISNAQVILFDAQQSLKRAEYNKKTFYYSVGQNSRICTQQRRVPCGT